MSAAGNGDLVRYADRVLAGTGITAHQVAVVVAGKATDAAAAALRAGWRCAANPVHLGSGEEWGAA
ncbi:hypothetical protein ACH47B_29960 [Rhodococcus sp. NPDC019627]|uniref:hypothetical protein n=1 Tax=unclassified Rhodococcus (in: high G+C Gram-positive bacteria) TaxID=192944 RepID=UPI00340396A7